MRYGIVLLTGLLLTVLAASGGYCGNNEAVDTGIGKVQEYKPQPPPLPPQQQEHQGVVNPRTGEYLTPSGEGLINPRTGDYYVPSSNGYYNPKTGEFVPRRR